MLNINSNLYHKISLYLDYDEEYKINQLCKNIYNPYGYYMNINGFILKKTSEYYKIFLKNKNQIIKSYYYTRYNFFNYHLNEKMIFGKISPRIKKILQYMYFEIADILNKYHLSIYNTYLFDKFVKLLKLNINSNYDMNPVFIKKYDKIWYRICNIKQW